MPSFDPVELDWGNRGNKLLMRRIYKLFWRCSNREDCQSNSKNPLYPLDTDDEDFKYFQPGLGILFAN